MTFSKHISSYKLNFSPKYPIYIDLLDNSTVLLKVHSYALGFHVLESVCRHIGLTTTCYFSLKYSHKDGISRFVMLEKPIMKQIRENSDSLHLTFAVLHYVSDISRLDPFSTELFYLQLKKNYFLSNFEFAKQEVVLLSACLLHVKLIYENAAEVKKSVVTSYLPRTVKRSQYEFYVAQILTELDSISDMTMQDAKIMFLQAISRSNNYGTEFFTAEMNSETVSFGLSNKYFVFCQNSKEINYGWESFKSVKVNNRIVVFEKEDYSFRFLMRSNCLAKYIAWFSIALNFFDFFSCIYIDKNGREETLNATEISNNSAWSLAHSGSVFNLSENSFTPNYATLKNHSHSEKNLTKSTIKKHSLNFLNNFSMKKFKLKKNSVKTQSFGSLFFDSSQPLNNESETILPKVTLNPFQPELTSHLPIWGPYLMSVLAGISVNCRLDEFVNEQLIPNSHKVETLSNVKDNFCPRAIEFSAINPRFLTASYKIGENPINMVHNNDPRVLPYDNNYVQVPHHSNNPYGYQNASRVSFSVDSFILDFIVAQNPVFSNDFWSMVWNQRVGVIICLDNTKVNYIPTTKNQNFGQVTVRVLECHNWNICMAYKLYAESHKERRTIWQLTYLSWNPNGTPSSFEEYIDFLDEVDSLRRAFGEKNLNSVLVHCSNGAGRSGLHVLLEYCKLCVDNSKFIDFPSVMESMRKQRMMVVTSLSQYLFAVKFSTNYKQKSLCV